MGFFWGGVVFCYCCSFCGGVGKQILYQYNSAYCMYHCSVSILLTTEAKQKWQESEKTTFSNLHSCNVHHIRHATLFRFGWINIIFVICALASTCPFLKSIRSLWFILTLRCCQQSSALVLRVPPVNSVCPAPCWELHSTHSLLWMWSLLSPLFLLFPLFPRSKTEKQRKSSKRDTERVGMGGGGQRGM